MAKKKNPVGRPTKYKKRYCEDLVSYFDIDAFRVEKKRVNIKGLVTEIPMEVVNPPPTVAGFCRSIGIHKDTFYEWVKKYPDFSDAYKKAEACQEDIIIKNTMLGKYEKIFSIFFLKANKKWRDSDKVDIENGLNINLKYRLDD